jgi:hypothetical protein
MKRLLRFGLILFTPFLVCDPQVGVEYYTIDGYGSEQVRSEAIADGSLRWDLASINPGTWPLQVRACKELWGCSQPTPFELIKPAPLQPPANPLLAK